jgi:hypothetical protein
MSRFAICVVGNKEVNFWSGFGWLEDREESSDRDECPLFHIVEGEMEEERPEQRWIATSQKAAAEAAFWRRVDALPSSFDAF